MKYFCKCSTSWKEPLILSYGIHLFKKNVNKSNEKSKEGKNGFPPLVTRWPLTSLDSSVKSLTFQSKQI